MEKDTIVDLIAEFPFMKRYLPNGFEGIKLHSFYATEAEDMLIRVHAGLLCSSKVFSRNKYAGQFNLLDKTGQLVTAVGVRQVQHRVFFWKKTRLECFPETISQALRRIGLKTPIVYAFCLSGNDMKFYRPPIYPLDFSWQRMSIDYHHKEVQRAQRRTSLQMPARINPAS